MEEENKFGKKKLFTGVFDLEWVYYVLPIVILLYGIIKAIVIRASVRVGEFTYSYSQTRGYCYNGRYYDTYGDAKAIYTATKRAMLSSIRGEAFGFFGLMLLVAFVVLIIILIYRSLLRKNWFKVSENSIELRLHRLFGKKNIFIRYDKLIDVRCATFLRMKKIALEYTSGRQEGVMHNKKIIVWHLVNAYKCYDVLSEVIATYNDTVVDAIKSINAKYKMDIE